MLQFLSFFKPRRCRLWLGTCFCWLLLSSAWLAHGQVPYPFMVRAIVSLPVVTTGSQPVYYQALGASVVYPAFAPGAGFDKVVNAVVAQPDGRILVGGNFDTYQGSSCNHLVRLLLDGNPDPSFTPPTLNGQVSSIALQPNGKILVGGSFNNLGNTHNYLMRLDTNGGIDSGFAFTGNGLDGAVTTIALQADGMVMIGGSFVNYGNTANVCRGLARLSDTGALDIAFRNTVGAPSSRIVNSIVVQANQQIVVGGLWGANIGSGGTTLIRLNPNGSTDTAFTQAITAGLPLESSNTGVAVVTAMAEKNGKLLIARQAIAQQYLYQLSSTGAVSYSLTMGNTSTDAVNELAFQADDKIVVGGDFHLSNSTTTRSYLARLETNFTQDASFTSAGGPSGKVTALAVQASQQVLVGGDFTSYNNNSSTANRLVRVGTGGALNAFDTDLSTTYPFTYAWSNGSTGRVSAALANGPYLVTATLAGMSFTSNTVTASLPGAGGTPSFPARITPTGPLNVCASNSRTLTALVPGGVSATYRWWKAQVSGLSITVSSVGTTTTSTTGSTYLVSSPSSTEQYSATAVVSGVTAATPTVTVSRPPSPIPAISVTGLPGTNVAIGGANMNMVTGIAFNPNGPLISFVVNSASQLTAAIPASATSGTLYFATACSPFPLFAATSAFTVPPLAVTGFTPQQGVRGSSVVLTGTGFVAGATAVSFGNISATSVTVASSTELTVVVPPNAPTGPVSLAVTVAGATATGPANFTVSAATPLSYDDTRTLPAGAQYGDLIITAPGNVTVAGSGTGPNGNIGITVNGRLEVQAGATLNITGNSVVVGGSNSSFLLAAGATLNVGHPAGLGSSSPPTLGAIQLLSRSFSADASYGYIGTQQVTGTNLPSRVRNLTSAATLGLTLSQPVSISQVLTMAGAGHFDLNSQALTLLSNATGTALVVNNPGAGQVLGNTATVQRYINPVANTGTGFRYYGAPVQGATAAVLNAPVFDYDQSRLFTRQDTLPLISYGFATGPLLPTAVLGVGRGYRAAVPAATTVQFTGTLNTGNITLTLPRTGSAAYNGWHLVSNPYPAPLNWSKLVNMGGLTGLDAAIYVYESTGTGTGSYRSYVNGISNDGLVNRNANNELLIATGQAFFVRVRKGESSGTLTFSNDYRETLYSQQASFSRLAAAAGTELLVALERNGSGGGGGGCSGCNHFDRAALYIDPAGASTASQSFNPRLDADASNLFSFSQQTLSIQGSHPDSTLAIRAMTTPLSNQTRTFPLLFSATFADSYSLRLTNNLPALPALPTPVIAYLHDKSPAGPLNREWTDLTPIGTTNAFTYPFVLSPTDILSGVSARFELVFRSKVPLATAPASAGLSGAVVYPNPTQHRIHVELPATPGATQVQATLLNALGQVVRRQTVPLPTTGTTALDIEAESLAGGIYMLRLQAGGGTATRRVVLER